MTLGTALIGSSDSILSDTRSNILLFDANSDRAQLCFPHEDDLIPCEASINGTLTLNDNSEVAIVEPYVALVTVQDDDCKCMCSNTKMCLYLHFRVDISAQFENDYYTIMEGQNNNEENPVIITASHSIQLTIVKGI